MATFVSLVRPPEDLAAVGRWYVVRQGEILTLGGAGEGSTLGDGDPDVPRGHRWWPGEALAGEEAEQPIFLGLLDGEPCWATGVGPDTPPPPGGAWVPLRTLGGMWPTEHWALAGRAAQLVEWGRTSRFCGRCGTPTELADGDRAMRCPACGLSAYPRLSPAVIVLVRRGSQALLAQNGRFRGAMFSTVAGFVEPGETLEDAVRREVREEVGVELGELRYFASQPWPFPNSLMVGFVAEWASGDIVVDGEEIVDARWFDAAALPPVPPSISIARRLIDHWIAEVNGAGS